MNPTFVVRTSLIIFSLVTVVSLTNVETAKMMNSLDGSFTLAQANGKGGRGGADKRNSKQEDDDKSDKTGDQDTGK